MLKNEMQVFAALLHDIGKLVQNAGEQLDDRHTKLLSTIAPRFGRDSTYAHAAFSHQILDLYPTIPNYVKQCILHHHAPNAADESAKSVAYRVALANALAHGGVEAEKKAPDSMSYLQSIFSALNLTTTVPSQSLLPTSLQADLKNFFPVTEQKIAGEDATVATGKYRSCLKGWQQEMQQIDWTADFELLFDQVLHVLKKYTLAVPSQTACISLYHHLAMSAALVNCLQSWNDQQILQTYEELTAGRTINLADAPVAAVIGCDFSGIQSFIYSVTSELALKGLRGRSMYLQLLSETLVKALLKTFRGTTANVIMNAGGNALLLMPYSSAFAAQMQTVKQSIEAAFLPAHRGKLTFSLAYEVVTTADLFGHRFADVHARVKRKLAVEKRKKFSSLLSRPQSAKDVFGPFDSGGDRKLCQVCSAELSPQEQREAEAEDIHQCRMCKSFVQLAYDITHAQAIVYRTAPGLFASLPGQITGYEQILEAIGAHLDLHAKAAGYRLNDTAFLTGEKHMSGFRFLPNHAPMLSERNPKKLEDLAECAQGVKAWGVVRMDVDHLGAIVGKSMVEGHTIETLSALSEMINLFFTAHVPVASK